MFFYRNRTLPELSGLGGPARNAVMSVGSGVGALRSVRKLVAQAQILARGDNRDRVDDRDLIGAAELLE